MNENPAQWEALFSELQAALGDAVRFDVAHRATYAADASNYRQVPIGVVVPRTLDEIVTAVEICRRHGAPILMRGAGTSQAGQTVNVAVILDVSRHCGAIRTLDPQSRTATVEPGVICDALRDAAENYGLTFAPDPSTHSRCSLGGMIANNSCGPHSVMAGKTLENVEALEVLTYDGARFWVGRTTEDELDRIIAARGRQGEIYGQLRALRDRYAPLIRQRFPNIKRRVSGFNLDQLLQENGFDVARALVGSEGTCALTLQAKVRLVKSPAARVILVLGFPDIYAAADAVPEYQTFSPIAIEGLDRSMIRGLQARGLAEAELALLPKGDAWVVLEFGADSLNAATRSAEEAAACFRCRETGPVPSTRVVIDTADQKRIWSIRENGASATQLSIIPGEPDPQVGWEDAAVDPRRLGDYLRAFQGLVDQYGYKTSLFGHFGDGCVHARVTFNLRTVDGVRQFREFIRDASKLVVSYGGSLSGEHGDGQARAEFLPIMYGEELMQAFREFKQIWDPRQKLNPGKLIDAKRVDENLRAGPNYKIVPIGTRLQFQSPEGNGFQRAVERCIGMGKCRSVQSGTMCPSYRATREERYSTRGRARLLWEMLQGEVVTDGWKSEAVKEALDTCLSCKGCRSDCPTHTDMASYKAEFLSHFYESRRRPRQAFTMGRIGDWSPIAARFPRWVNLLTQAPGLSAISKRIGGVAANRTMPRFAAKTFREEFLSFKSIKDGGGRRAKVLLWVDTFCEHFHPEVPMAAVAVLAAAGIEAVLPPRALCCGRPLYDFGYVDRAREKLSGILDMLGSGSHSSLPIVGLEPGCMSVFKDELLKQFPSDPRAKALAARTFLLGGFLHSIGYVPPRLAMAILVHTHCHQKSVYSDKPDLALLELMGAKVRHLDSGCCGMAGSFGFSPEHVDLSKAVGELVLLPAVRREALDTVILTNGFSCREQIEQGTGRKVLHLAEVLNLAVQSTQPTLRRPVAPSAANVAATESAPGALTGTFLGKVLDS